jgi:DNA-binding transcriptional LysR family regulator
MLLNAAAAGFGIALVPELLARAEARSGRLDYLLDQRIELSRGYYACFPRERRSGSLEEAVTRWMREEADRDQIDAVNANTQKTSAQQKKR